jgi:hypothetical protein
VTNKGKIAMAAAVIAAFATPALAQYGHADNDGYQVKHESYASAASHYVEGRNAAVTVTPGPTTGTISDRESMIRAN